MVGKMMPVGYKYNAEGSTPSYTNPSEGVTIERDTEVRVRIKGLRGEITNMYAIGSIKEDYLGYVVFLFPLYWDGRDGLLMCGLSQCADAGGVSWCEQYSKRRRRRRKGLGRSVFAYAFVRRHDVLLARR